MTNREVVITDKAPKAVGPYSQAIMSVDFIFTAGQIAINPATGNIIEGDFKSRVRQILSNLDIILREADSSLDNAVKLTVFLTDLSRFDELNDVFREIFSNDPPARSAVQVSDLPLGTDVEIDCIAVR
ncbi:MAG: reactive intermediate/imine deaminase [Candidatus Marinimicrobia bacterium]|nr:reactive intermediate/imine deaminase [Candidatus Neomarinimicrobiota bacterium]